MKIQLIVGWQKIDDRYFLKLSIPDEKIFLWFYFVVA